MKVLAVNHFFRQDLDALGATSPGHELVVIEASVLHDMARRCFPGGAFAGMEGYRRRGLAFSRLLYAAVIKRFLARVRAGYEFDLFVVPSDTIFYLREPIRAMAREGIPTVVVQKETGMSPWALEGHARETGRLMPFMSDAMTVNSELHKRFWMTSGAAQEQVLVTGQPRFDYYATAADSVAAKTAVGLPADAKSVLFLSYMLSAYVPGERDTWAEQRKATEQALMRECADAGAVLAVKPHPQQSIEGYSQALMNAAASAGCAVRLIDSAADTRVLMSAADVVVGFQSTAMYEAVAAGRPTLYAGWAPEAAAISEELLPLWDVAPAVMVAQSAEHLRELVSSELREPRVVERALAARLVEGQLGTLDGGACQRVWAVLEQFGGVQPVGSRD